jgi:hypothetical protein
MTGVEIVSGISKGIRGELTFDVEVSADGNTLLLSDGHFAGGPLPRSADLAIAIRGANCEFHRLDDGRLLANIKTSALEYAGCLATDQRELFFTRIVNGRPAIYHSIRNDAAAPCSTPQRVEAIQGFAEAPALSRDGRSLYYHARRGSRFVIERVVRR